VLNIDLPYIDGIERAKHPHKLPVVFTRLEVESILARSDGTHHLIASLLYGAGLRLMEASRLRVKDVDFARGQINVREGKGAKDRMTMLPDSLTSALRDHK
jgi:integrase